MSQPQMDWQVHKTTLSARFKELYENNQWTDCAFRVGVENTEILRGHRVVLAASSPVFEALFYGSLAEKKEFIDVPDLDPHTFQLLLKYMYCDCTEMESIETTGNLLYAAKKYMTPHLARVCLDYLLEHTFIHTLWQVLAIAEDLHEDELISACLKVMCQFPGEMWLNNNEHIGLATLSRLLEQQTTNLLEVELWQLMTSWARDQCTLLGLSTNPSNQRAVVDRANLLGKMRFLTLTLGELAEIVEPSGLLTDEELRAVRGSITAQSSAKDIPLSPDSVCLPVSFNTSRELRKRFTSTSMRCTRYCMTKRKNYTYCGTLKSTVSADSRILVTGFEVFTRIATTADYIMGRGLVNHYLEDLTLTLCDEEGNLINRTELNGVVAFFNVTQEILLSQPVWFLPEHRYTIAFELSNGQYPLSDLAPIAYSKSICFRFSKCEQYLDASSFDLDFSFINSIIFSM